MSQDARIAELEKSVDEYRRKFQRVSDMPCRNLQPFPDTRAQMACAVGGNQTGHDAGTSSQSDQR